VLMPYNAIDAKNNYFYTYWLTTFSPQA